MTAPTWLSARAVSRLPAGAAVRVDVGGHKRALVGRVVSATSARLVLLDRNGVQHLLRPDGYRRVRVVDALWAPGDLVLRRGVDEHLWRGAVLRAHGTDVQVDARGGPFWLDEGEIYDAWVPPTRVAQLPEASSVG